MEIKRITELSTKQLLEVEALEHEVFADGGLNRWVLPVVAHYGYLFVLLLDQQIIGLTSFITKNKTAFLIGFWVKDSYRNQGLGNKLLSTVISELKKDGIHAIELTVDKNNQIALNLYKQLGFESIDKLPDFYGPNNSRLLFKLNLLK